MSVLSRISDANRIVYGSQPLMLIPGVLGLLAALLLKEPRWLGIVVMMVGLRWWLWVRTTTPPFVLFLSTSDTQSIEMHRQTKRLVSPLRVITLLDLCNRSSSDAANELFLDCLRTGNDDDWWKVITILIELTPLVVINADTESPGVVREALHIITEDYRYKTIFLTKGDACLLRRESELAASASGCFVASSAVLQGIIKAILDGGELPKQGRSVRSLSGVGGNANKLWISLGSGDRLHLKPEIREVERISNRLLLESATCSQCHAPMTIFLGVNSIGIFPTTLYVHESHRGCYRCTACGRHYCWDCSDSRKPCSCGNKSWQEQQYFPDGVSPEEVLRGLV